MDVNRRRLLALGTATAWSGALTSPVRAAAAPISALGLDAAQFGLRPGSPDDQGRVLQRAVDEAARARVPLAIAPGSYRVGHIKLPTGAQLVGVRGATKLIFTEGPSLLAAENADHVALAGLVLDGSRRRLPERRGLVHVERARRLKIADCEIVNAGGSAIHCIA